MTRQSVDTEACNSSLLIPLNAGTFREGGDTGLGGTQPSAVQARFLENQTLFDESLRNQGLKTRNIDAVFDWVLIQRFGVILRSFYDQVGWPCALYFLLTCALAVAQSVVGYRVLLVPSKLVQYLIDRDESTYWRTVLEASGWVVLMVLVKTLIAFVVDVTALKWREALVKVMEGDYLEGNTFYRMLYLDTEVDNPDQRIVQDVKDFTDKYADVVKQIITAPVDLVWYTYKANQVLGWLAPVSFYAYFLLAVLGNKFILGPIIRLSYRQEKLEGDYRYIHVRLRTNAESIALYNGAESSGRDMAGKFALIFANRMRTLYRLIGLNTFTNLYAYVGGLGPYLLLSIPMFAGASLGRSPGEVAGDVYKAVAISISLMYAFTQFVNVSQDFSSWAGSASRIGHMAQYMARTRDSEPKPISFLTGSDSEDSLEDGHPGGGGGDGVPNPGLFTPSAEVSFDRVTVYTPTGVPLAKNLSFTVLAGEPLLIMGPSGCGKSSLLRVLGGLWPSFTGTVATPPSGDPTEMLFLPQQPCISVGTLREQVTYPLRPEASSRSHDTALLIELLDIVGLAYLSDMTEWDATINWPAVLSPGEQQRLAMARVFYHRPKFVVMDEATSAVEEDLERALYLRCRQQDITTVSVGQRSTLRAYHKKLLTCDHTRTWSISALAESS